MAEDTKPNIVVKEEESEEITDLLPKLNLDGETEDTASAAGTSADFKAAKKDTHSTAQRPEDGTQDSVDMVTFTVEFDSHQKKLYGLKDMSAPGNQPILHALQDDSRFRRVKNDFPKVFLDPLEEDSEIKGEPNIGSPCSSIAGGKFKARFNTKLKVGQGLSVYDDDRLKSRERFRFYMDVSQQKSKSQWITKKDTNFHFRTLLIDCLPDDTLLSALLRDGRIDNSKVRKSELTYEAHGVKLTDDVRSHHDKTFVCKVVSDEQVTDGEWQKALEKVKIDYHENSSPTMTESPSHEGRTDTSASSVPSAGGTTPKVGKPVSQENKSDEKMYAMWLKLAAVLGLDFTPKESEVEEKKRRKKLDKFAEPFVQKYHNINQGTTVLMMKKLIGYSNSVGGLFKDGQLQGTCFRVGPRFVLTNKHVIDMAGLSSGSSSDAFVEFNYLSVPLANGDSFRFNVKEVMYTNSLDELDYSIVELDIPENQLQTVQERLPGLGSLIGPTTEGSTVTIIGHPGCHPKKMDVRCPVVNPNDFQVTFYLKLNPNETLKVKQPGRALYNTTFAHGSSGSPGFDQNGKLVVVHARGYPMHAGSTTSVLEQGIRFTAIFDDLKQTKPDLFHAIFPKDLWNTAWSKTE